MLQLDEDGAEGGLGASCLTLPTEENPPAALSALLETSPVSTRFPPALGVSWSSQVDEEPPQDAFWPQNRDVYRC